MRSRKMQCTATMLASKNFIDRIVRILMFYSYRYNTILDRFIAEELHSMRDSQIDAIQTYVIKRDISELKCCTSSFLIIPAVDTVQPVKDAALSRKCGHSAWLA